jgi:hypothetical protein
MKKLMILTALALGISYAAANVKVEWKETAAQACEREGLC